LLSYKCEESKKSDDEPKDNAKTTTNCATAATMKSSEECGGAWTAEEVDDEPDWFKGLGL